MSKWNKGTRKPNKITAYWVKHYISWVEVPRDGKNQRKYPILCEFSITQNDMASVIHLFYPDFCKFSITQNDMAPVFYIFPENIHSK